MREINFILDSVQLLYYRCHKINFNNGSPSINSPYWKKHKKATIDPKSEVNKWFQYVATVALYTKN